MQNRIAYLGSLDFADYTTRPTNTAVHNLSSLTKLPNSIRSLLSLGLKFCPMPTEPTPLPHLEQNSLNRFDRDIDIRAWFENKEIVDNPDDPFNPNLYTRSNWDPPTCSPEINHRKFMFQLGMKVAFRQCISHSLPPNLSRIQRRGLKFLQRNPEYLVVQCDKNLGPCVLDLDRYVKYAFRDHLSDGATYQRLNDQETRVAQAAIDHALQAWLTKHKNDLTPSSLKFLRRKATATSDAGLPCFYLTMKIHKEVPKTRPIVSCSGSKLEPLGKWLDDQLQPIAQAQRSFFKSSHDLKKSIEQLAIPDGSFLFTADATSMYTNIPTNAACTEIESYIRNDWPHLKVDAIVEALRMIMEMNYFQFGDTNWKQLIGTAMGAPPAPPYATIFYGIHEHAFLDDFSDILLYYRRFIDDVFGIFRTTGNPTLDRQRWLNLQLRMNTFHGLEWTFTPLSTSVDFMDLTIRIESNTIVTSLFEKALNIYQYLPPRSCHPPGVITGLVYGNILRTFLLCSKDEDITAKLTLFYHRLRVRGWESSTLIPLFIRGLETAYERRRQAATPSHHAAAQAQQPTRQKEDPPIFLHLMFNPLDPPSRIVHQNWQSTFMQPRNRPHINYLDDTVRGRRKRYSFGKLTVCYHRQPNLGNLLSYRRLKMTSGRRVSDYVDGDFRQELATLRPRSS